MLKHKRICLNFIFILISGCDPDICKHPPTLEAGKNVIVEYQCLSSGGDNVALMTLENIETHNKMNYIVSMYNGKLILNQDDLQNRIDKNNKSSSAFIAGTTTGIATGMMFRRSSR